MLSNELYYFYCNIMTKSNVQICCGTKDNYFVLAYCFSETEARNKIQTLTFLTNEYKADELFIKINNNVK